MPARQLPVQPDLRQLKHQAKDLLRAARNEDPDAIAEFREFHPGLSPISGAKLSDAQLVIARRYDAPSWPHLVAVCNLIDAISSDNFELARTFVSAIPQSARDDAGSTTVGWRRAIADAASAAQLRVITSLQRAGAPDFDAAAARPELHSHIGALRLLGQLGARVPTHAIGGAVESLAASNFAFMLEIGNVIEDERGDWRSRVALALETYARNPTGKHRILETMVSKGIPLPATPPMAVHRGRLDLLEEFLSRDPNPLQRTFTHQEIFPPELGCHEDEALALVGAPLHGATLLHIATEYEETEIVQWLLDRGMNPDVPAQVDASGFGGHTALFNCVVSYNSGRRDDRIARILLSYGANPNARASLRKRLAFARDTSMHEYRDVTPLSWGMQFHDQSYVSQSALRAIADHGGQQ